MIRPNDRRPHVALSNRLQIELGLEGGGRVDLPAGDVWVKDEVRLGPEHSGRLQGRGRDATVLRSLSPTGRTLLVHGDGIGYTHKAEAFDAEGGVTLQPTNTWGQPFDASQWARGRVCWGWIEDGYITHPPPQPRRRRVIRTCDAAARWLAFDEPADPELTTFKWCDGVPITGATARSATVWCEAKADARTLTRNQWVYVSDGPSLANEARGEYARVADTDGLTGAIRLDRPLGRDYAGAALVRVQAVAGLALADLTIAAPLQPNTEPLLAKFCVELTLERVRCGRPGERCPSPALTGCGFVTLTDCMTLDQPVGLNTCHDVTIRGGQLAGLNFEEGCVDVRVRDTRLVAERGVVGLRAMVGCQRIEIENSRLEGFGHGGALIHLGDVPGATLRNIVTSGNNPHTGSYLAGDGIVIEGLTTDVGLTLVAGRGVLLRDSHAPGWELRAGTTGQAVGCTPRPAAADGWVVETVEVGEVVT
jgi:hypothetical protein